MKLKCQISIFFSKSLEHLLNNAYKHYFNDLRQAQKWAVLYACKIGAEASSLFNYSRKYIAHFSMVETIRTKNILGDLSINCKKRAWALLSVNWKFQELTRNWKKKQTKIKQKLKKRRIRIKNHIFHRLKILHHDFDFITK